MRPVHPKIDGALYRPTTTAACGTATATDDSLGYYVIKFVKGRRIPEALRKIGPIGLDRTYFSTRARR